MRMIQGRDLPSLMPVLFLLTLWLSPLAASAANLTGLNIAPQNPTLNISGSLQLNDKKQDSNAAPVEVIVVAVLSPMPTYTYTPTATATPVVICPLLHEGYDGIVYVKTAVNAPVTWESNTKISNICSIIDPPNNGTATVTPLPGVANTCAGTYVPNSGYIGSDSFQYYFIYYYTYQGLDCAQQRRGSVAVTVGEFAVSDVNHTSVSGMTSIWIPVVGNPYGKLISCRLGTPPANGTATVASDCSSGTYQSLPGFIGTDSFTYIANDGQFDSNPGTVTVAVTEPTPNDPCLAQYPVTQFSQTGKAGTLSITFTGNITSHTNKEVKVCPGTALSYTTTSTHGPVLCKVKNNTTRGSGTLRIKDHLKCTDKPTGKDKVHFKVKSGVK
ncbi:MAG: Ig-like domain-containing protein [Sulfuricaulis sp.]|nr:Ig-like domain-containing protein [Sulfuricaulis sp.]